MKMGALVERSESFRISAGKGGLLDWGAQERERGRERASWSFYGI